MEQFSTTIALDRNQEITQEIVRKVYGNYFSSLSMGAIVMVVVALIASIIIRKMLAVSNN
ncbi:MAG: hypothetical protein U0T83_02960 [Bacteriovoracaceae bacterium]